MTCSCGAGGVLFRYEGESYCPSCYDNEFVDCAECGTITRRSDATEVSGAFYCQGCFDDNFCECDRCCSFERIEDIYEQDGGCYCEDCFHEQFFTCDNCGNVYSLDNVQTSENCNSYCEDCYCEVFTHCASCGAEILQEDALYNEDGSYCIDCWPSAGWQTGFFSPSDSFTRLGSRRRFGVELEVNDATGYEDLQHETCFGCKEDGSLGHLGKEFVSPILSSDASLDTIDKFCRLAQDFKLDTCCGFHIHLDMSRSDDFERERIAAGFALMEDVWHCFVPSTRRDNRFCYPIQQTDEGFPYNMSNCRQCWLNLYALRDHGTIEIRLHSSTLNAEKVGNWAKLNLRFADYCAQWSISYLQERFQGTRQEKFDTLCDIVGLELGEYYAQRAREFGIKLLLRETA